MASRSVCRSSPEPPQVECAGSGDDLAYMPREIILLRTWIRPVSSAAARIVSASGNALCHDSGEEGQGQGRRYGCNESHRDKVDEERYPHGLTDAEWKGGGHVFEHAGPGGSAKYPRRTVLDACVYVLRSGCSW